MSLSDGGEISQLSLFRLTVEGIGIFNPIIDTLTLIDRKLEGTIVIPAGPDRKFTIEGIDDFGAVIYRGRIITDIEPDETLVLDINLYPQVPMVKLSPAFFKKPQNATVPMNVRVYNLAPANMIEIVIDNSSIWSSMLYTDSVVINPILGTYADLNIIYYDESVLRFQINHINPEYSVLDDSGYANLATIFYPSYSLEPTVDTFTFAPTVSLLLNALGETLSVAGIHQENSTVELYQLSYHTLAYWWMDYPAIPVDSILEPDQTGHGLDGIAHGTTFSESNYGGARVFDGVDDFIEVPHNDLLNLQEAITLSLWISIDSLEAPVILMSKRDNNGPINYQLTISDPSVDEGVTVYFEYGPSLNRYRADIPNIMDNWSHHIVLSYEFGKPATASVIIDAKEYEGEWIFGSGREAAPITTEPLQIGRNLSDNPFYFKGAMDEVIIFDVALDLEVIQQLPYWQ